MIKGIISGTGLSSGTMSVGHDHAGEDEGSRGGEVRVIGMDSSSDLGTSFVHEDASDGVEGEFRMIEGMSSGSGSGSSWTFITEGVGVY